MRNRGIVFAYSRLEACKWEVQSGIDEIFSSILAEKAVSGKLEEIVSLIFGRIRENMEFQVE